MTVELKWVPSMEASDHRKAGWQEVLLYAGLTAVPGYFLMASPPPSDEPKEDEKFDGGAA